jgi:hypothetical protein
LPRLSHMKCSFMCFSNAAVQNVVDLLSTAANHMDPTVWASNLLVGTINYHYSKDQSKYNPQSVCVSCTLMQQDA